MTTRQIARAITALTLCGIALTACNDGGVDPAQPDPTGGFQSGALTGVPVPDFAVASGAPVTSGNTTTQSYLIDGVSPQQLITDEQNLTEHAGWTTQTAAARNDTDWTLTMFKGDTTLVVATSPAATGNQSEQTQLSLEITP